MKAEPAQSGDTVTTINVAAILFDMDGVLVSSILGDEQCWKYWASGHELGNRFDVRETHGCRAVDTVRKFLPGLTQVEVDEELRRLELLAENQVDGVTLYPGVSDLLASLPAIGGLSSLLPRLSSCAGDSQQYPCRNPCTR